MDDHQKKRKAELKMALILKGLKFRRDSKYCKFFVETGRGSIDKIVDRMCQMKYLFDYKAGKVISEQAVQNNSKEEMDFFTDGGITYKMPGITDLAKRDKFVRGTKVEEIANMFGVSPQWVQNLRRDLEAVKGDVAKTKEVAQKSPVWNLNNGVKNLMNDVAELGITPEKLTNPGIRNVLKQKPSWSFISIALDPEYGVMSEEEFFQKLGKLIEMRMKELQS